MRGQEIIPLLLRAIIHEVAVEHQRPGLILHTVQLADRVFVVLGVALDVGKHVHGSLRRALQLTERLDDAHVVHRPPPVIIAVVVAEANLHILRAGRHVHANGLVLGEDILIKDGDFLGFPAIEGDRHRGSLPILSLAVMVVEFHIHSLLPRYRDSRAFQLGGHGIALGQALLLVVDDGESVMRLREIVAHIGTRCPGPVAHIAKSPALPAGLARVHALHVRAPPLRRAVGKPRRGIHLIEAFLPQHPRLSAFPRLRLVPSGGTLGRALGRPPGRAQR